MNLQIKWPNSRLIFHRISTQELYPKLALMVKSICCGPSTTVASESDFSMGSDFVWAKRNRLSARRLQHLNTTKNLQEISILILLF